jgi:hypothetical protein
MADTDPVAAELTAIRRFLDGSNEGEWYAAGRMLLSAVDKVLATANDWQRKAEINRRLLARWNNPHYTVPLEAETKQLEQCAEALRSAVLAGLTGKEDGGAQG